MHARVKIKWINVVLCVRNYWSQGISRPCGSRTLSAMLINAGVIINAVSVSYHSRSEHNRNSQWIGVWLTPSTRRDLSLTSDDQAHNWSHMLILDYITQNTITNELCRRRNPRRSIYAIAISRLQFNIKLQLSDALWNKQSCLGLVAKILALVLVLMFWWTYLPDCRSFGVHCPRTNHLTTQARRTGYSLSTVLNDYNFCSRNSRLTNV